jgi:transposase
MKRFVAEADRGQWTLLPECLDDCIDESNPVRVIDVFVDALDLTEMSFEGGLSRRQPAGPRIIRRFS